MTIINRWGYVVGSRSHKDWYHARFNGTAINPIVHLGDVRVPRNLLGKRLKFKVEVLEDDVEFEYE